MKKKYMTAAVVIMLVCALAGCGESKEPKVTVMPTVTTVPTVTAVPTVTMEEPGGLPPTISPEISPMQSPEASPQQSP